MCCSIPDRLSGTHNCEPIHHHKFIDLGQIPQADGNQLIQTVRSRRFSASLDQAHRVVGRFQNRDVSSRLCTVISRCSM